MVKNQREFLDDYNWGLDWETKVADLITRCNPYVDKPAKFSKVHGGRVIGFDDDGDMRASVHIGCKRRRLAFTGREDYPFPTVFVDEEYKLIPDHMDREDYYALPVQERLARIKWFHSYWIASSDMNHVALIVPATKRHWILEKVYSPKDRRDAFNWACPVSKVIFGKTSDIPSLLTWT